VIEEGGDDPTIITQALGAIARSRNLSEIARRAGMCREGLYNKALSAVRCISTRPVDMQRRLRKHAGQL